MCFPFCSLVWNRKRVEIYLLFYFMFRKLPLPLTKIYNVAIKYLVPPKQSPWTQLLLSEYPSSQLMLVRVSFLIWMSGFTPLHIKTNAMTINQTLKIIMFYNCFLLESAKKNVIFPGLEFSQCFFLELTFNSIWSQQGFIRFPVVPCAP